METPSVVTGIALDENAVSEAVSRVAHRIVNTYPAGTSVIMAVVLEGARTFSRALTFELLKFTSARFELSYLIAQSYHGGIASSGTVEIDDMAMMPVEGRNVLVVDDVYDTGRTLAAIRERLIAAGALDVRTCVLLEKDRDHEVPVDIDFRGAVLPDRFLIGYGLDLDGKYRDLPYVAFAD